MPTLQAVLPQEIIDAVKREGDARKPRASQSRVAAEAIIERYGKQLTRKPTATGGATRKP